MEKHLIEKLPEDYKKYFTPIQWTYKELRRADALGLITYTITDGILPLLESKNYHKRKLQREKEFEILKYALPSGIKLNLPKEPLELKVELELKLSSFTTDENIKRVIKILFDTKEYSRPPRKNNIEKLKLFINKAFKDKIHDIPKEDFGKINTQN